MVVVSCGGGGGGGGIDMNGLNCHPETCHNDGHWVEVDFGEFETIEECQALCGCHPEATSMQYNDDGWCGCMTLDDVTFADAIEGGEHLGPWDTCTICDVTEHNCGGGGGGGGSSSSNAAVTTLSSSADGMTTYQLHAVLSAAQSNVYALAGTVDQTLVMPPAFQVAAPFGSDVGGVSPAFYPVSAAAEFDSWLTVGVVDGSAGAALSTIGLGLEGWTLSTGLAASNGAVFWMNPDSGPGGTDPICLAQVTVPEGSALSASGMLQGRSASGEDWSAPITWGGGGGGGGGGGSSDGVVQVSTGASGTTVQLTVTLEGTQSNVYALAGTPDTTMTFPAAFQVAAPFGTDIGGVSPAFFAINAAAEFDSWLSIGPTDGTAGAAISASPGLGLDQWTDSAAFSTDNGAIFWMNPADGPGGTVVVAQVTNSGSGSAAAVIQGRSSGGGSDFQMPVSWSW
eukprot:COSAG03_NODE_3627_length_1913_cov_26.292744_1_plen_454_part_00